MIEWNPNDPEVIGVEHTSIGYGHVKSDVYQDQWGLTFEARHTGAITDFRMFLPRGSVPPLLGGVYGNLRSPTIIELHNEGDEDTGEPLNETFEVTNIGTFTSGTMTNYAGGNPTVADINSLNSTAGIRGWAQFAFLDLQFNTAAFPLNRRIIRMGLEVWGNAGYFAQRSDVAGASWDAIVQVFASDTNHPWAFYHGEAIANGSPKAWTWITPQYIRDFRSGGPNFYRIACWQAPGYWAADYIRMHVVSVPENRIGVGLAAVPSSSIGVGNWVNIPLKTPAATGNPAVTNGNKYTAIIRRTGGDSHYPAVQYAPHPFRYLRGLPLETDDYKLRPVINVVPDTAETDPGPFENWYWLNGTIKVLGLGDQVEGVTAARFVSGGSYQPETQPYEWSVPAALWTGAKDNLPTSNAPASGCSVVQLLDMPGGETIGQVSLLLGLFPGQPNPNSVSIEVRNSLNATVLGGPAVITFDDWNSAEYNIPFSDTDHHTTRYKRVRGLFPSPATLSAGTYTVIVRSDQTPESAQWKMGILWSSNEVGNVEAQSFGTATHFASGFVNNAQPGTAAYTAIQSATSFGDAQVMLATVPGPPLNVQAELSLQDAHHVDVGTCNSPSDPCAEETVPGLKVTWESNEDELTALYEVQRKDATETEWVTVAITTADVTEWTDLEARMGDILTCYRIRGGRLDGITGEWSATACAAIPSGYVALSFTSNHATGMSVALPEAWETSGGIERTFQYGEAGDVEHRLIYGSDGQFATHPAERRGVRFSRTLLLNALVAVQQPTLDIAKPLRDLAWVQIPYVCVRDGEGNRWFASVTVPGISNKRRGERWFADITVTEGRGPSLVRTFDSQVIGL